jgi:hypothetical protein
MFSGLAETKKEMSTEKGLKQFDRNKEWVC